MRTGRWTRRRRDAPIARDAATAGARERDGAGPTSSYAGAVPDRERPDLDRPERPERSGTTGRDGVGLEVVGLTRRFGRVPAIEDVSLRVRPGEVVAVVGENGAGKSTLVRCIAGDLLPHEGTIHLGGAALGATDLAVVWQDLGLCDDLDVVANVFLGREPGRALLAEPHMHDATRQVLDRIGADLPDLRAEVATLSRGQRQEVALARALVHEPRLLVLDEPTASLSVAQRERVVRTLGELRRDQAAILLITHDLDEVFALADRIVVLRRGRVVAQVSPAEVHPDDVGALMSGIEGESMARRQLHRLHSLVEQLSAAAPAASVPLVLSATSVALDEDAVCLHLLEHGPDGPVLRRGAAVGVPAALLTLVDRLPLGTAGATIGLAAERQELQVAADLAVDERWAAHRDAVVGHGMRSTWSAPIVGAHGVLGTITAFAGTAGPLPSDRVELISLYAGHAATAIEREQLFDEVSRRNRVLEALRGMLESLAGPDRVAGGLQIALLAVARGAGARQVGVLLPGDDGRRWVAIGDDDGRLRRVAERAVDGPDAPDAAARVLGPGLAGVRVVPPEGAGMLVARTAGDVAPDDDALQLLDDAARSLALALERERLDAARAEADAARRSEASQQQLLQRLSHELRTPLTAIHGYASTLRQPDLTWDAASTDRFLGAIATESARMERLVGDLLDSSALESGVLRLRRDWTDLPLVVAAARACVAHRDRIEVAVDADLEPIWADHDRLEQVLVNLLDNAVRHGGSGRVEVRVGRHDAAHVEVVVRDDGPGVPPGLAPRIFDARVRGDTTEVVGAGLGLAIARGIAEAHGGRCELLPGPPTAFRVVLPVEPPDGDADGAGADAARADAVGAEVAGADAVGAEVAGADGVGADAGEPGGATATRAAEPGRPGVRRG